MAEHLYDCVPVHGSQGLNGGTKAYACYNCMEFFAELSVAFLWQNDCLKKKINENSHPDSDSTVDSFINLKGMTNDYTMKDYLMYSSAIEYNKWYPHNFIQLYSHDRKSCEALALLWDVDLKNVSHTSIGNVPDTIAILSPLMDSTMTANDLFYTNN